MKYRCYFVVTIAKNRSYVAEKFVPSIKLAIVVFKDKSIDPHMTHQSPPLVYYIYDHGLDHNTADMI